MYVFEKLQRMHFQSSSTHPRAPCPGPTRSKKIVINKKDDKAKRVIHLIKKAWKTIGRKMRY